MRRAYSINPEHHTGREQSDRVVFNARPNTMWITSWVVFKAKHLTDTDNDSVLEKTTSGHNSTNLNN